MNQEIYLYGSVGGSFWDEDYFTPSMVRDMLVGRAGDLTVRINSGGGIASDGQAIYTMLKNYPGKVNVIIDGVAASAASLIAMAGDTITMPLGSTLMIHDPANPWVDGRGTEEDHLNAAKGLKVISDAYSAVYASRAGITPEEARAIMRAETYYDGPSAVAAGFATGTDDATQAALPARFDYGIYAHAPQELRRAGGQFTVSKSRTAVMAMMAGIAAPQPKESHMTDDITMEDQVAATTAEDDEEDMEAEAAATEAASVDVTAEDDEEDMEAAQATASTAPSTDAAAIRDLCVASNRPESEALEMIVAGLSLQQAVARINENRAKENPVSGKRTGATSATITRDERTTRRKGMMHAISAQIMGSDPTAGEARQFMNLSLVEMAAECIGHKGKMRTAGERLQVFMDASHSTSDFPAIFENALNKVLLERYRVAEPTYRRIARKRNFNDFRAHPQVRAGDFPKLQPVSEAGEIKFGSFGEAKETAILKSYGVGLRITRQMMVNDELGAIDAVLSDYGQSVADFEEETFYSNAFTATMSDGQVIFHSSHNNLAGSGAAITVAAVGLGRAAMRKQTTIDGKKMNLAPSILLVGPDKETEAEQLVAAIQPQQAGNVNPFSGRLEVVTTAQVTGNAWHLFASADRPGGACYVYGYLDGAEAPRIRTEEPFGQQGMALTLEHDFGFGVIDYRGAYKNPGA